MGGYPFRRNLTISVEIERVSTHQRRSDHRAVHVGASGDILGDPPYNFSRFSTPEHPFYLARQGPRGTLNSTAELSLFLRRPISHQCQQERLQRAGVQLESTILLLSLSLLLKRVSRIRNGEARRGRKRRKQRGRRCTRIDGER